MVHIRVVFLCVNGRQSSEEGDADVAALMIYVLRILRVLYALLCSIREEYVCMHPAGWQWEVGLQDYVAERQKDVSSSGQDRSCLGTDRCKIRM